MSTTRPEPRATAPAAPPTNRGDREAPIVLSMGDPCGIGPEIIVKALAAPLSARCVVVGDVAILRRAASQCGLALPLLVLDAPGEAGDAPPGCLPAWQPPGLPRALSALPMGRVHADAGRAAITCIEAAAALARDGRAAALVTAPIHKQALAAAGSPFAGHTEMLQALAARGGTPPRGS